MTPRSRHKIALTLALLLPGASPQAHASLDTEVRRALLFKSRGDRESSAVLSDVLLVSLISAPLATDIYQRRFTNFGLDAGTLLFVTAITGGVKELADRDRPYVQECAARPDYAPGCGTADAQRSFFSGHASATFASAALICAKSESWCPFSYGAAGVTGMLRIMSDRHYFSDVLVGAAVGTSLGYFIPRWAGPWIQVTPTEDGAVAQARFVF